MARLTSYFIRKVFRSWRRKLSCIGTGGSKAERPIKIPIIPHEDLINTKELSPYDKKVQFNPNVDIKEFEPDECSDCQSVTSEEYVPRKKLNEKYYSRECLSSIDIEEHIEEQKCEPIILMDCKPLPSIMLLTIELLKFRPLLGFRIVGGTDSPIGNMKIFITHIKFRSVVQEFLQVGDEILSVNQIPLAGMTHEQVVQVFNEQPLGQVTLRIKRNRFIHQHFSCIY